MVTARVAAAGRLSAPGDWALVAVMGVLSHPVAVVLAAAVVAVLSSASWVPMMPGAVAALSGLIGRTVRHDRLPGRPVRPADEPELAGLVQQVAERLDFRAPIEIRILPTADAVLMRTQGFATPTYAVALGWPLLRRLPAAQLAAVVAHELSHRRHTSDRRLSVLLGMRESLAEALNNRIRIPAAVIGRVLRVTQQRCWDAELAADAGAASLAGTETARAALERIASASTALDHLAEHWIDVLAGDGHYPEDLYEALDVALADPYVQRRIADLVAFDDALDPYAAATHPPLAARLAALPEVAGGDWDGAAPLRLRTAGTIQAWCVRDLVRSRADPGTLRPARILDCPPERFDPPFDEARVALRAATGRHSIIGALHAALDAVADGSWPNLTRDLDPEFAPVPPLLRAAVGREVVVSCLDVVIRGSLLDAGWERVSRWGTAVLMAPDGELVDLHEVVGGAVDSGDPTRLRALLATATPRADA